MTAAEQKELQTRAEDLTDAMKWIGRLLSDKTLRPAQRMDRALGILARYGCAPNEAPQPQP